MATSGEQREHGENGCFTNEETPLLSDQSVAASDTAGVEESLIALSPWRKPKYFLLIETAIFTNVFLAGFDGTVTASTYAVISSDLQQSNLAAWITTSYLLTSTAIQPLYGRFSDIFGRRACLLMATAVFGLGCLGCACSTDMTTLIMMRALTGLGGGGLMTMNLIPRNQRGIYQAFQNILHGSGAICGTTVGGVISDTIGWRVCFLGQVPVALAGLCLAATVVKTEDQQRADGANLWSQAKSQLDLLGAALLFAGLVLLLAALTLGVDRSWDDWLVVALFVTLFLMPFFFQTVLLDSASSAGLRLVPPSLGTPIGGLITGIVMRQGGDHLTLLTRLGLAAMLVSNILLLTLGIHENNWKYSAYLTLGNFAQGMVYPSILFGFIRTTLESEHAVATSLVYLTRSLGTVFGVSSVATIVQGSITQKLEEAFGNLPGGPQALKKLLKSISEIQDLEPELKSIAIKVVSEKKKDVI
ncbi:multidrug efflux transporter (Eurofung) [Fusarium mundagurra]|uniref:Multidrug efflux transporter (Eurofung) n=1 Tax=Fusarium mundagurra TaxID=1567541 RepID=A0A8H6DCV5_9HYPO|nr:multidrug efflux transporter (Eurofung) [Fusarium mundagurra]